MDKRRYRVQSQPTKEEKEEKTPAVHVVQISVVLGSILAKWLKFHVENREKIGKTGRAV
jgi:hypothetical protein